MKKITIEKPDHHTIPCLEDIPKNCHQIVILIHGILSSKESANAEFMMQRLSEKGIGSIAYDQPGHGTESASEEPLRLTSCLKSLILTEDYLLQNYPDAEICYFASSFGAYVLGICLSKGMLSGHKAFMRCAAVHFPQMVFDNLPPKANQILKLQGYIDTTIGGRAIQLSEAFLKELKDNSLIERFEKSLPKNVSFSFVHGEKDPVVPVEAVKSFAQHHGFPLLVIPDEGHTISDHLESPGLVADQAYQFFTAHIN